MDESDALATARVALAGRREAGLLELPSVRRCAIVLATRCREPSWTRLVLGSLERFRTLTGIADLEDLLARAQNDLVVAGRALGQLAAALDGYDDTQVAALGFGPKVWFRTGGVPVPWRPLPAGRPGGGRDAVRGTGSDAVHADDRALLLALIGSGLTAAEFVALRVRDLGSISADGQLLADLQAEPLAVRYRPLDSDASEPGPERLTFLTFAARRALHDALAGRAPRPADPLVPAGTATLAQARARALIEAGNEVNVALCRATGDFFRAWGMPGSRFQQPC